MPILEREGNRLYYELLDCTPPWVENPATIFFCHGVGANADIWSGWLPVLTGGFRVVRMDMRGFGRSSVPAAGFDWSLDLLVSDVLAVADAAQAEDGGSGGSKFHYVGESLGGTVGLALAAAHGERLLSLTACSTAHKGGDIRNLDSWRALIEKEGMEAWSELMMGHRFHEGAVPEPVYQWFHRVQMDSSPVTTLAVADMLMRADLSDALARITTPTLLLSPDASPFVSLEITRDIQARIPGCEVQVFAGARHGLACSHGQQCASTLLNFLQRHKLALSEMTLSGMAQPG